VVTPLRNGIGTSEDIGRVHASLVLRAVLAEGPLARAEIADRVGLTRATVTRVTGRLLEIDVLREGTPNRANPGRPMVPLELGGDDRVVVTAHFGVAEIRVGTVNIRGEMLREHRYPYVERSPEAVAELARRGIGELAAEAGRTGRVLGVGASMGGWVDPATGVVVRFTPLGWRDVPFGALLTDGLDLPHYFDHTVRGLALAERMVGAAKGYQDLLALWVGNVVGAAIVNDGVARQGPRGAAGSIAHFPVGEEHGHACECGRTDCLQEVVTDGAVLRDAIHAGIVRPSASIRTLVQVALDGDEAALELVAHRAAALGRAAAAMSNLVNPPLVLVAGLLPTAPGFMPAFTEAFTRGSERAGEVQVTGSAFGDASPTVASASFVLEAYYRDPFAFEPGSLGRLL
jgi:predicted NBD/HSP70 family sugar kinase